MLKKYFLFAVLALIRHTLYSQALPDLQDATKWKVVNRTTEFINDSGKKAIRLNEVPGDGLIILKGSDFSDGVIELDIKGSNKFQQSFVGLAFHCSDSNTYDAVYFRPFNFKSNDASRRSHSVQYVSMPGYDWERLRNEFPGKYENKLNNTPGPNDWFHARIMVNGKHLLVYVNNEEQPSLEVEKLNNNNRGEVGLWVGNNSGGSFANLDIEPFKP